MINSQYPRDGNSFNLTASYARPAQDGLCPVGSRRVSVEQGLVLPEKAER